MIAYPILWVPITIRGSGCSNSARRAKGSVVAVVVRGGGDFDISGCGCVNSINIAISSRVINVEIIITI